MVLLLLSRILWILFLFPESLNMLILPLRVFSFPTRRSSDLLVKNLPTMQETLVQFLGQEDSLEKG